MPSQKLAVSVCNVKILIRNLLEGVGNIVSWSEVAIRLWQRIASFDIDALESCLCQPSIARPSVNNSFKGFGAKSDSGCEFFTNEERGESCAVTLGMVPGLFRSQAALWALYPFELAFFVNVRTLEVT